MHLLGGAVDSTWKLLGVRDNTMRDIVAASFNRPAIVNCTFVSSQVSFVFVWRLASDYLLTVDIFVAQGLQAGRVDFFSSFHNHCFVYIAAVSVPGVPAESWQSSL